MDEKLENFPHILWINLEKDKIRKQYMESLFSKYHLLNSRIDGIIGNHYLEYCYPKKLLKTKEKKGEYGCFLSHLKALDYFVNTPSLGDYCLIAEDDLSFEYLPFWEKTFWDYINTVPKNFNVVQLSVIYTQDNLNNNLTINIQKHKWHMWGTGCYLIKRKAAEKLLKLVPKKNNKYNLINVKHCISDCFIYNTIDNVYCLPLFTYNTLIGSNIHEHHIEQVHIPSKKFIKNLWKNK